MEETQLTFAHFIEEEALEARVAELGGQYTEEEVAAAAVHLAMLALSGFAQLVPIYGDPHYFIHLLANIYAGEYLTDLVTSGVVDPEKSYEFVLENHAGFLGVDTDGMEDIKSDGVKPMDEDTFNRLWGG